MPRDLSRPQTNPDRPIVSLPAGGLPVVRRLPTGTDAVAIFERLRRLNHVVWFDSSRAAAAADDSTQARDSTPTRESSELAGRYSFLTADPVRWMTASIGDPDPWPTLRRWARRLPASCVPGLPPFQGGIAGLIGYEAATWIEPVPAPPADDLATASIAVGLYDWVIAIDHVTGNTWLFSQGLGAEPGEDRGRMARRRADEVERWLDAAPAETGLPTPPLSPPESADDRTSGPEGTAAGSPRTSRQFPTHRPDVTSNFSGAGFRDAVAEIVRRIGRGDSFQVNLAQRLLRPASGTAAELYLRLRHHNPAPFAGYLDAGSFRVVSSSPEGFLKVRGREVETRPIKGTVPRTGDAARDAELERRLRGSEKDHAENVMIVDLMRNDLSRVCEDDSVVVSQLCEVERYAHVQHLVSAVRGRLRAGADTVELLRVCFPGGSVTGAPKVEAMRTIAELEPNRRGPYCGSLGYIGCGGDAEFNILIRTITSAGGYWQIPVGGGITARSNPADEEAETWAKAAGMLEAT